MVRLMLPFFLGTLLVGCQAPVPVSPPAAREWPSPLETTAAPDKPAKLVASAPVVAIEPWGVTFHASGQLRTDGSGTFTSLGIAGAVSRYSFTVPSDRVLRINRLSGYVQTPQGYGAYNGSSGTSFVQHSAFNGIFVLDGVWHYGDTITGVYKTDPLSGERVMEHQTQSSAPLDVIVGPGKTIVLGFWEPANWGGGWSSSAWTAMTGYLMSLDVFMNSSMMGVK